MDKAKRARTVETPKQPSLGLKLRAPCLYPDQGWWCGPPSCGGYGPQDPRCYGDYRPRYGYYERREREERRERRRRDFYEDRRYYWR